MRAGIAPHIDSLCFKCRRLVASRFTPLPLYPWEKSPGINWIGGCLGSRFALDIVEKRNIVYIYRESKTISTAFQLVAIRCAEWTVLILMFHSVPL
jgi:hypothetical protein